MQRGSLGSSSPLHAASTPVYGDVAVPRSDGEARFWLPYRLPLPVLTHDVLKHDVGAREYYSMFRLGAGWKATIHHRLVGDGRERVVHKGSINADRGVVGERGGRYIQGHRGRCMGTSDARGGHKTTTSPTRRPYAALLHQPLPH